MINQKAFLMISGYRKRTSSCRALVWVFCLMFSVGPTLRANTRTLSQAGQVSVIWARLTQEGTSVRWLEEGKQIERELGSGQSHSYQLNIVSGQYVSLLIEQKGIDVIVKLFAPNGELIIEVDSPNGTQGPEPVRLIAEATGIYRLEVSSLEKDARPGRYEAKLIELRAATQQDRDYIAARRAFDEGEKLHVQATRSSLTAAIKKYEEALSLYRAAGDRSEQITVLINMGGAYRVLGEHEKALAYLNQVLQAAQALGNKNGQGQALMVISAVYRNLGEFEKALQSSNEALQLYQSTGEKNKEAIMLKAIGELYSVLGEQEKARDYYDRVMRLYQALGNKNGEAGTLHAIGYSYIIEDEFPKGLDYYSKALMIWQLTEDRQREAIERSFVANEYARAGERQKALEHSAQALLLRRAIGDFNDATVLTNVGHTYNKLGDYDKALDYYKEALGIWQTLGDKRGEAITLKHVSSALRDKGRLDEAQVNIEKAIALLEFMRDHAGNPELQSSFVAGLFDFYEYYIDLLMRIHAANPKAGSDLAALAFTEKVKLRSLIELLTKSRVDLRQGVDAGLLERERSINQRITFRLDELTKLQKGKYTDAQWAAVEREINALRDERRRVQAEIRERSPRYAALTEPQPLSVREIQQQVLDGDTILLEYALGSERSYLWAVTPEGVRSYQLPPKAEIEAQVRRVYQLLIARQPLPELTAVQQSSRERTADAQYQTQAAVLSKILLEPVAAQLGTKRLLVVADGALQYLPFAVLPAPSTPGTETKSAPRPLILEHEIVSLPSASVLAALRREAAERKPAAKLVAVLADPVFEQDDARVKQSLASNKSPGSPQNRQAQAAALSTAPSPALKRALRSVRGEEGPTSLPRLLFSRDEAEAILSMAPQQSGLKAVDFRANRNLAMSDELAEYRVIHFSTHGLLDSRYPELSGLVLSLVDEAGQPQEGFLRLHEIYNLRLNAQLVVLSACQTGLGKEVRGEGLIGLTRGFMYAGVPRVMTSLWEVDDAATAELMKRFYRGVLQEKLPPSAALRAAQIEMLKKSHWQSPYFWGAFVLQGEWR